MKNEEAETFDIPMNRKLSEMVSSLKKETLPILLADMETALRNRAKAFINAGA